MASVGEVSVENKKKAVVILPMEIYGGNINRALTKTFKNWDIETYTVTQKVLQFGYNDSDVLTEYNLKLEEIVEKCGVHTNYYVIMGGMAFLNVYCIDKLSKLVGRDRVFMLAYSQNAGRYIVYDMRWRRVDIEK